MRTNKDANNRLRKTRLRAEQDPLLRPPWPVPPTGQPGADPDSKREEPPIASSDPKTQRQGSGSAQTDSPTAPPGRRPPFLPGSGPGRTQVLPCPAAWDSHTPRSFINSIRTQTSTPRGLDRHCFST